jgi:hypothetical protein
LLHFGAGCHQIVSKTFEFLRRVSLASRFVYVQRMGYGDRRTSEQLLDCHYIHDLGHESGRKRVAQRMLRHTFDSRFSARQSETRLQIDEWISGFLRGIALYSGWHVDRDWFVGAK